MSPRWISALTLVALLLAPVATAAFAPDGRTKAFLAEVKDKKDKTPQKVFEEVGKLGHEDAFDALCKSLDHLKGRVPKQRAFNAMRHLMADEELRPRVIEFALDAALGNPSAESQAAARGLTRYGEHAHAALRDVLENSKSGIARAVAMKPILPALAQEGGKDVRRLVLDNFVLSESGSKKQLFGLIQSLRTKDDFKAFASFVSDDGNRKEMRRLVVLAMEGHPVPDGDDLAGDVVAAGLKGDDAQLQYHALTVAERRGAPLEGRALRAAKKLAKSKDDATRRAATLLLLNQDGGNLDPVKLAGSRDPIQRQAAAVELGGQKGDDAFELLSTLLVDKDWKVRVAAIRATAQLRDKRAIPLLIERLGAEQGRLRSDALDALELLTGRNFGLGQGTWKRFWQNEGDAFTVPPLADVRKALAAKGKKADEKQSRAAFYGIQTVSKRFALVIDASLSMQAKTKSGRTRMDIAREQLNGTIERLEDGTLFNIIAFAARTMNLADELVVIDDDTREDAFEFVDNLRMKYGTDTYDALFDAFKDVRVDTIYLVTDGDSSEGVIKDPDALRDEIRRWNSARGIVIHCIAVGKDHRLLRGLAEDSGGKYVRVD